LGSFRVFSTHSCVRDRVRVDSYLENIRSDGML
jgi:hypothetical protein